MEGLSHVYRKELKAEQTGLQHKTECEVLRRERTLLEDWELRGKLLINICLPRFVLVTLTLFLPHRGMQRYISTRTFDRS